MLSGFCAVVEVHKTLGEPIPSDGIVATYLASRRGPILMVLDGVSAEECDRVLDPVVRQAPARLAGVAYASRVGPDQITRGESEIGVPLAVDSTLKVEARRLGIPWINVVDAARLFQAGAPA